MRKSELKPAPAGHQWLTIHDAMKALRCNRGKAGKVLNKIARRKILVRDYVDGFDTPLGGTKRLGRINCYLVEDTAFEDAVKRWGE